MIETERLQVIPLTLSQFEAFVQGIDCLEKIMGWTPSGRSLDEDTREAMLWLCDQTRSHPENWLWYTNWQILERQTRVAVGSAGFKGAPDASGAVEIGYGIYEPWRNQGFMKEACLAVCSWALGQPGVKIVTAETALDNPASHCVLEYSGMRAVSRDQNSIFWTT